MAVRRRLARLRGGALTTEAALFLPALVLTMLVGAESGWMSWRAGQVEAAARQGAAVGAAHFGTTALVNVAVSDAMQRSGLGDSGYLTEVEPGDVLSSHPGDEVTIVVTVPYRNVSLTRIARLPFVPQSIRTSVTLPKEGPYRPGPGKIVAAGN